MAVPAGPPASALTGAGLAPVAVGASPLDGKLAELAKPPPARAAAAPVALVEAAAVAAPADAGAATPGPGPAAAGMAPAERCTTELARRGGEVPLTLLRSEARLLPPVTASAAPAPATLPAIAGSPAAPPSPGCGYG
jgi:hypothetical protein